MGDSDADALVDLCATAAADGLGSWRAGIRVRGALIPAFQAQTDRSAEREVASFLHLDGHVAVADGRAGLRCLHFHALEDAEAVEFALRLQHRDIAERLSRLDA